MDTTTLIGYMKGWHGIYDAANEDAITNVECLRWINMARRWYARPGKLRFSEFEDTLSTVISPTGIGQRAYDLPTGWMSFQSLYYLDDNNERKNLEWYSSYNRFLSRFPDKSLQGTLVGASQWGNQLILGLIPNETVVIYRSGHKLPADLTLGATDDMLDEMWEAIMWAALVISGEYTTVPEQKQSEWKQRAYDEAEILRVLYRTSKTPPGRIITQDPGTITPQFEED